MAKFDGLEPLVLSYLYLQYVCKSMPKVCKKDVVPCSHASSKLFARYMDGRMDLFFSARSEDMGLKLPGMPGREAIPKAGHAGGGWASGNGLWW